MSWPQIIITLKIFKNFLACKIVLGANHHYPGNIQRLFLLQIALAANHHYLENIQRLFLLQTVLAANQQYLEIIQRLFWLQNCVRRKSSLCWKYSKNFSPAKLSSTQITIILKIFKDFFPCNIVLDANHHYPGNIQRLFHLQIVLAANHHYPENIQRLFLLQIVLAANHHYLEIIQRLFWLQNCLSRKSSLSWKHSKTFSPAKLSSTQITIILKIFKVFFVCNIVLAANHHYPENIQKFSRLQNCLRRKSPISWKYSKIFSPAILS